MSGHTFRPSVARVQNAQKIFTSTKTNATIRDLEEEEGELEEKEGTVVSIKRDLINGAGWTVKDKEGQTYICSCASSMYEVPDTVERGGILYPKDTVEVTFTVNPVLRINIIKEIKSLGEETESLDIGEWKHEDESTTVIAKPKSAVSISNGLVRLSYKNEGDKDNNEVSADKDGVKTSGKETNINTDKLSINSKTINIGNESLGNVIDKKVLENNIFSSYSLESQMQKINIAQANNLTQLDIYNPESTLTGVVGDIKDQKLIPTESLSQRLITDGDCIELVTVHDDGAIEIHPVKESPCEKPRTIVSLTQWLTSQTQPHHYIKVAVKKTCGSCTDTSDGYKEYINYCPHCGHWNVLQDTPTSEIKCMFCFATYCENCGTGTTPDENTSVLKEYDDNYITGAGTTCSYCKNHLLSGTTKYYVNYCTSCGEWNVLTPHEITQDSETINLLACTSCGAEYCCTCGINQKDIGLNLSTVDNPVQYDDYKEAFRKLKYIKG